MKITCDSEAIVALLHSGNTFTLGLDSVFVFFLFAINHFKRHRSSVKLIQSFTDEVAFKKIKSE